MLSSSAKLSFTVKYKDLFILCQCLCLTLFELSLMMLPASSPSPRCSSRCFCFYTICIVLEVFCAINLHPWDVSALPPPSAQNSWHWIILTPPTVCLYSPSCPSSFSLVSHCVNSGLTGSCRAVWRLARFAAQDESSSNLFQGEAGSVRVEVHQAAGAQCGAFLSLCLWEESISSCTLSLKPKHLWKELSGMSAGLTDSAALTTTLHCFCTAAAPRNGAHCIKVILILILV